MNFRCIADEQTVRGFRLAGIAGQVVTTPSEAAAALRTAAAEPGCGVVILTEETAASLRAQVDAIRFERERPLIVEIPGPHGALPAGKTMRQMVQEAVGIRVT
jgi:V/A-type H+/Na+-transporting ATPase subunit F